MIPAAEPYTLAVLTIVRDDPGIVRARLYATPAQKDCVDALIAQDVIMMSEGCRLTPAGERLCELLEDVAGCACDTRYKDVRARIISRYERRLAYMKKKREGDL